MNRAQLQDRIVERVLDVNEDRGLNLSNEDIKDLVEEIMDVYSDEEGEEDEIDFLNRAGGIASDTDEL